MCREDRSRGRMPHLHLLDHLLCLGFDGFLVVGEVLHHAEGYFMELGLRQLWAQQGEG